MNKEQARAKAKKLRDDGDTSGLRALVKQAPYLKSELRDLVKYANDPDFILAFAEELVDDDWVNREIGEAAVKKRDLAMFARAFAVDHDEENFVLWESSAHELYKAGDIEGAHVIYAAIIERPAAAASAWHGWLATLRDVKPPAARLADAAKHGAKHPVIFHELACVYVRLGEPARAIENVAQAVQYAYGDIAKMKADDDLAPLRGDKRFAAAFKAKPRAFDLAELEQTMTIYKKPRLVMKPVLGMFFYFATPIAKLGPLVAAAIEQYMQQIAPATLGYYKSGHWKALKKGGLGQQLGKLKKVRAGYEYVDVAMRDGDGDATDHAFSAELRNASDKVSELRFTYARELD
ncbi:MAG: hypothetical protein H0T65_10335, partial [Deltaproteobacteria bacterium]|nr:hypothetical protein [Deltaproteobacteria bacterium]